MVHWIWIPVALFAGFFCAVFVLALCRAAGDADDRIETIIWNMERQEWEPNANPSGPATPSD